MMKPRYDAIVVGAGPAGCAAAYDLCEAGRSVLLLDRRSFPRLKVCAGGLTVKSLNQLRYDVTPVVLRDCREMAIGRRWVQLVIARSSDRVVAMTERADFDEFCLRQTMDRGAEFRVVSTIDGIVEREDMVELIVDGEILTGGFVIGADGAKSRIRELIGEGHDWFRRGLGIEVSIPLPANETWAMQFDFGIVDRGYGWAFPKNDHLNIGLYSCLGSDVINRKALEHYIEERHGMKIGDSAVRGGALGLGGENYHPGSRRIFLAGDAAGLVEPLMAEGIFNAIKSGQCAARAIDGELSGHACALESFREQLASVQADIRYCAVWEKRLYRHFDLWCGLLRTRPIRAALMEGYARGRTFSEIRRRWLSLLLGFLFRPLQ